MLWRITFVDIEINGVKFRALVDTGFNGDVLVSKSVAEKLRLPIIGESERRTVDNRVIKDEGVLWKNQAVRFRGLRDHRDR